MGSRPVTLRSPPTEDSQRAGPCSSVAKSLLLRPQLHSKGAETLLKGLSNGTQASVAQTYSTTEPLFHGAPLNTLWN